MSIEKLFAKNYAKALKDAKKEQKKREIERNKSLRKSYIEDFRYRQKIGEIPKNQRPNF